MYHKFLSICLTVAIGAFSFSTSSFADSRCSVPPGIVDGQRLVHSMGDGIVSYTGYDPNTKKTVRIEQAGGLSVSYGNLGPIYVVVGQQVKAGDIISLLQKDSLLLSLALNDDPLCGVR